MTPTPDVQGDAENKDKPATPRESTDQVAKQASIDNPQYTSTDHTQLLILQDQEIIKTISRLQTRISERFPTSGLQRLCGQLLEISKQASKRSSWIARPIYSIRIAGYLLAIGLIILLIQTVRVTKIGTEELTLLDLVTLSEPVLNEVIILGAVIYFLISFESRIKRGRAIAAIHELRTIAHVIDMHQLTKDPERLLKVWKSTENSPRIELTPALLNRYLDYCSEMLSLTGKIASLYVQHFDDPVLLVSVSEIEQLTTGLSRKIWQKIMILQENRRKDVSI